MVVSISIGVDHEEKFSRVQKLAATGALNSPGRTPIENSCHPYPATVSSTRSARRNTSWRDAGRTLSSPDDLAVPMKLGVGDGEWTLPLEGDRGGLVYSFGIGWTISFDLDMINRFGCEVTRLTPHRSRWSG